MSDDWNERAAKCLGWQFVGNVYSADYHRDAWMNSEKKLVYADNWNPYGNHNHAALLEAEVERRGLREKYIHVLWGVVISKLDTDTQEGASYIYCDLNVKNNSGEDTLWYLITATPAQRTEAAVLTLEGDNEKD